VDLLYATLLGAVQGLTEFLPVSSSAHLILISAFVDGQPLPIALNIALHLGTLLAVLIYFWRDWLLLLTSLWRRLAHRERSFHADVLLPSILLGSIPAGVVGILWQDEIEAMFHHPLMTALPLAVVGIALWAVDRRQPQTKELTSLTFKNALIIGCAQALALVPGVSRSGITILSARLQDFKREDAARFSFLLGTPAMAGAALINHRDIEAGLQDPVFYIGVVTSLAVGCLAIGLLLRFLRRFGFGAFAVYRVVLAALIVWKLG